MRFICRTIESEQRKLYECIGLELIDFVFDWWKYLKINIQLLKLIALLVSETGTMILINVVVKFKEFISKTF